MPTIVNIVPIPRQQGIQVPDVVSAAQWVDALSLTANVAKTYILPIDAAGVSGTVLGITATDGPLWINFNGAAVIPVADNLLGTAPVQLNTQDGFSFLIAVPNKSVSPSFICGSNTIVTIEAWS